MNKALLDALAEAYDGDDRPGVKPLDINDMREWAGDDNGGGLPTPSARAFANWLDHAFFDWADESNDTQTNGDVLKGARAHWVGEA